MLCKKFLRAFSRRSRERRQGKKETSQVFSTKMMVVAPITMGLAFPTMSPTEAPSGIPAPHQPAITRDEVPTVAYVSPGPLDKYSQEEPMAIDGIPQSTLLQAGSFEGGEERRMVAPEREFGGLPAPVPTKPATSGMAKGLGLRRWVASRVASVKQPARSPVGRGFQYWLRDDVGDLTVDLTDARLYGKDRPGPKRTVHPRPWDTVLVANPTPPKAACREQYREFAREAWYSHPNGFGGDDEELAAFEQWMAGGRLPTGENPAVFVPTHASFYQAQGSRPPPQSLCKFRPKANWSSVAPVVW
ncbi:hypothetical protein TWF730_008639 [Orbilia blumenaviensis]|uniref:Transmembrane protein n=1 Tax=Orbilia blumenaviensis TaxID=1796055 RepID=A0AAV9V5K0_9PEZI